MSLSDQDEFFNKLGGEYNSQESLMAIKRNLQRWTDKLNKQHKEVI